MLKLNQDEKRIITAVKEGGKVLKHYFDKHLHTYKKTCPADFYTRADIEAEEKIIGILEKHFKRFNISAEESGYATNGSEYTFVIDPLDGTNNFSLGIPYFSVAVGLKKGSDVIFSVIYNPMVDHLYYAKKGKGAYKNGKKISINKNSNLTDATIVYISGYSNITKLRPALIKKFNRKKVKRIMDNWCPTLDYCLLASGKVECVVNNDDDLQESSIGRLIIREAGGILADFHGQPKVKGNYKKFVAANNRRIMNQIMPMLKQTVGR